MNLHDITIGDTTLLLEFMRAKFNAYGWVWWEEGGDLYYRTAATDRMPLGATADNAYWLERAKQWERDGRDPDQVHRY